MIGERPAVERMAVLVEAWEQAGDRRAIFLGCYTAMTRRMLAALDAGRFHDAPWVRSLLERFADYYFDALDAYGAGQSEAPAVWCRAHGAAARPHTLAVQSLLLGVSAHVNYDLVFAVVDVLQADWPRLSAAERQARHDDFCLVNQIIAETVDEVQDEVLERHAPAMDVLDTLLGPLDEWVVAHVIARWRDEVWDNAVRWLETPDDAAHAALRAAVEAAALAWAARLCPGAEPVAE